MEEIYSDIGKRIEQRRKILNMTRDHLAEMLDISSNFLYSIERGTKGFSADLLYKISEALDASNEYLLFGSNTCSSNDILNIFNSFPREQHDEILNVINLYIK